MDRLAHLKRELERRFPTVEAVREQAPDANEFAGEVEDHKIYEFFNPMLVRLRHATRRAARSILLHSAPCRGRLTPGVRRY
jgi:hypothetical protein